MEVESEDRDEGRAELQSFLVCWTLSPSPQPSPPMRKREKLNHRFCPLSVMTFGVSADDGMIFFSAPSTLHESFAEAKPLFS